MKVLIDGTNINKKRTEELFVKSNRWDEIVDIGTKIGIVYHFVTAITEHIRTDSDTNKEAMQLHKDLNNPDIEKIDYDYVITLEEKTKLKDLLGALDNIFWEEYKKMITKKVAISDKEADKIIKKMKKDKIKTIKDIFNKPRRK